MPRQKLFGGDIVNGRYTLRTWIDHYKAGKFNDINFDVLVDMGCFDWFGNTDSVQKELLRDIANKVVALSSSPYVDCDKNYVIFKQNMPLFGPKYCDLRICSLETNNVLFTVSHLKKGCHESDFSGWEVWDFASENANHSKEVLRGTWNAVKKYFKV